MTTIEATIRDLKVAAGTVACVWLGQAGYLFKSPAGVTVMVDPYLSEYALQQWGMARALPPAIDHTAFTPDVLLSSHWHEDHLDQPIVRYYGQQPGVIFGGPGSCYVRALGWGWPAERCHRLDFGKSLTVGDVTIRTTFARHEGIEAPALDAVGFLLEVAGLKLWDVADSEYDARLRPLANERIDVAFVPINGVGGNMTDREAALLMSYVRPGIAVPMHYNMWPPEGFGPGATLDPEVFVSAYKGLGGGETRILTVGEIVTFRRSTAGS